MKAVGRLFSLISGVSLLLTLGVAPAIAQNVNGACLYSLDPIAQQAFFISGNATITTNCSIVVESNAGAAFEMGGTDTLYLGNHAEVGVVGGYQLNGQSMIDTISNQQVLPVTITSPGDPLASIPAPTQGTIVSSSPVTYSSSNPPANNTLSPGVYCGGLAIANSGGVNYTMSPGTYIMAGGGFKVTSSAMVQGSGVTVYNTSSTGWGCTASYAYTPISIDGQANVSLSAPTSGPLTGILLFGDRNGCATPGACQDDINGQATATFNGLLYLKSDLLLFNGKSSSGGCMAAVADKITINGDTVSGGNSCYLNPIAVSISPQIAALYGGQTQQFTATVTNTYFTNVTWSISPAGVGSIDSSGNYTAPSLISTQQTVTVTATSQADSTKSASATVTLFPPETIGISPTSVSVNAGQTQPVSFTATVTNALNTAVTWSISPAGAGSIDGSGNYTPPASVAGQEVVAVTATSVANPSLSVSAAVTVLSPIAVSVNPPSVTLTSGETQQFTATVINTNNAAVTWSLGAGSVGTISASGLYTAPARISSQQTVTVIATSQADPTKSASAMAVVQPSSAGQALTLTASNVPPYVVGTSQQFTAVLKNRDGSPLSGISVSFAVTGVNNATGTGTTDANGAATFAYSGTNSGNDTVQATAIVQGAQATSNPLLAGWVVPVHPISTTTILGRFFPLYAPCCTFSATPAKTPAFAETFPTIDFDPPSGAVSGNNSVGDGTVPFTDVTVDSNGNFSGTIVAQGNGYQAWNGSLRAFQAVFTGSFIVKNAGEQKITVFVDNAFTMGIGGGATPVSWSGGGVTPFNQYPVMGALSTSIGGTSFTVNFPGPGTYPYELDYVEDGTGLASLMMMAGATGSNGLAPGVPSGGTLSLSPNSVQSQPLGGQQTFTVVATDAAGNPVPDLSVGLVVSQDDNEQLSKVTDSTGTASFTYTNSGPGTDQVQAIAIIDGMVAYSNQVKVPWGSSSGTGTGSGLNGTLSVSISAPNTVILPNSLSVNGTATDSNLPQGDTIATTWSEVSGPGSVTFADPQQLSTTASFSAPGTYALELSASDVNGATSAQIQVTVDPQPGTTQGWIGSPANGSAVSGIVPITTGVNLASGTLTYYPANSPNSAIVLNPDTTGTGQIGTLDTTTLANGSYWITLQGTTTGGTSQYNLILVTVTGNNKPGRVTTTVTDLVVPFNGLPIKIQRTYDSLYANTLEDFGYGWRLGTNVDLTVDPMGNVSFTLNGQRKTFHLTPSFGGWLFPWYYPAFTAEPGLFGTLEPAGSGCPDLFDFLVPDGNLWACIGGGFYTPPGYTYTDPTGTSYTMTAQGQLQSIVDKNGNTLTIVPSGITSSNGLSVTFARDSQGRITSITDPQNNVYQYGYLDSNGNDNGNLQTVTYPVSPTPATASYNYLPGTHLYQSGTDFRGNALPTADYFATDDTDAHNNSLAERLKSVGVPSDTPGQLWTTSYMYDLTTNTTTVTYPDTGTATMVYDSYGDLLNSTDPLGHKTVNTYDANHNLTSTTDPLGNITCYAYDSNGNRTSTTLPQAGPNCSSIKNSTTYNQFSEPTSTTDELNNVRTFSYDVNANPVSVTDSLGTLASFVFNPNGTMAQGAVGYDISADPSKASTFTYDVNGNLTGRSDALGRITSYGYNSLGQKTSMTAPPQTAGGTGATTTYKYDAFGNLTETDAPLGRITKSQYDGDGNKISDTDANQKTTGYKYDALNRLAETDYPDSTIDKKTYDFRGNMIDETDQAGHITHHVYDLAGRLSSVTYAFGTGDATTVTYTYDNDGRKLSETDSLGHATSYTYDAAGNLLTVSGVKGNFTYTYDNARNRVTMTDGNNNQTTYVYDARKRLTETDYPDGTKKTYAYDGPGNLTLVTDQANNQVQYSYDAANQLTNVVQLNSPNSGQNTTIYGYDGDGNPIVFQDANTHTTYQSFDLFNELSTKTLPDGSLSETRTYDANGNLHTVQHFNGATTTYAYDSLNRLLSRSTPGEPTVSFTYTATGKRATMDDASGHTIYTYDNMDRLSTKQTPEGTLSYTYDAAGNLASIASSNANGASMSYTYDSQNRLSSVTDKLGTSNYAYDGASNVSTVTYPSGVQTDYQQYDAMNRILQMATQNSGYIYQRGPTGNLTNVTELNGRAVQWSFDGIYRLTNEQITGDPNSQNNGTVSYTGLDPVGNRLADTSSLAGVPSGSWSYNQDDQLSGETYDQDGNVTAANGKTFSYDSQNEMLSMNGGAVQMIYDGDGNRVAKSVTSGGVTTTTQYLVDDLNPTGYPQVMDEITNGVVSRTYTYGLQRISEDQLVNGAWTPSFYSYDGMGSVRQLTSMTGTVTDSYEYDAFGNQITHTGSTPNNYLYRGEQWDSDLGLYYLRARYYNPLTGRFMSRDPYDGYIGLPVTLHKYLYAGSDPVNHVDPRGRFLAEYAVESADAIPEAKLVSIYGCIADASLAAVDLLLDKKIKGSTALSVGSTVIGCVLLTPEVDELAQQENVIVERADFLSKSLGWGACALNAEDFIDALNGILTGKPSAETISESIESLGGCVGDALGQMITKE